MVFGTRGVSPGVDLLRSTDCQAARLTRVPRPRLRPRRVRRDGDPGVPGCPAWACFGLMDSTKSAPSMATAAARTTEVRRRTRSMMPPPRPGSPSTATPRSRMRARSRKMVRSETAKRAAAAPTVVGPWRRSHAVSLRRRIWVVPISLSPFPRHLCAAPAAQNANAPAGVGRRGRCWCSKTAKKSAHQDASARPLRVATGCFKIGDWLKHWIPYVWVFRH